MENDLNFLLERKTWFVIYSSNYLRKISSAFEEAVCVCTKLREKIISCNVMKDAFSQDFAKNMEMISCNNYY